MTSIVSLKQCPPSTAEPAPHDSAPVSARIGARLAAGEARFHANVSVMRGTFLTDAALRREFCRCSISRAEPVRSITSGSPVVAR